MNCAEIENLICEYIDGTLAPAARAEVEKHLDGCAACAEMVRDAAAAVRFIGRAAEVEPPPELLSGILFHSPWRKYKVGWWWKPFNALLQPKFAMSMALTVLSIFMIVPKMGQPLQPKDLAPAQVWGGIEDRAYRFWARTQKFYDNLKFVYQIQTTLREWQQSSQEPSEAEAPTKKDTDAPQKKSEKAPAPAGKSQ
jgi:hypothetical protein